MQASDAEAPAARIIADHSQRKGSGGKADEDDDDDDLPANDHKDGFVKIHIPLHGMDDGMVYLPDNLSAAQWAYALKITKFLLDNYRPDAAEEKTS